MSHRWALIVGPKGSGKTSLAARVARELTARGVSVDGVLQAAVHQDGERVGFQARRVGASGDEVALARRGVAPEGTPPERAHEFCSYVFDDDAFVQARRWVEQAANAADVVIVDEVSKLEVARGGHYAGIKSALGARAVVLLVVRADQLFAVVERFELEDAIATLETADEGALSSFVDAITRAARP